MGSATSSKLLEEETSHNQSQQASNQTIEALDPSPPTLDQLSDSNNEEKVEQGKEEKVEQGKEGEEEEEEGECGFCLFMKGGGCKDAFIAWEDCVEAVEKDYGDIVEKCSEVTLALKKCMDAHSDYYAPILQAEKVAEEEAVKQLEKEKEATSGDKSVEKDVVIEVEREVASEEKKVKQQAA